MNEARSSLVPRPDADDAVNLYKGNGYVVKDGKISIGHFRSDTQAINEALKKGAKAYKICRDESRPGATALFLEEVVAFDSKFETPSESIAESVRTTLNIRPNEFISPIMKSRVIMILKDACKDLKPLAFEAYAIIFPYSNKSQFDRIWSEVSELQSSDDDGSDKSRSLSEFAKSRGIEGAVDPILSANSNDLVTFIETSSSKLINIVALIDNARKLGLINSEDAKNLSDASEKFCLVRQAEDKHGSVIKTIRQFPALRKYVLSRNYDAIADFLSSRMDKNDAKMYAEEMVKIAPLIKANHI